MRPGQLTPENIEAADAGVVPRHGFNEAGAINPGKPPGRVASEPVFGGLQ